jgi:hypothetical protein
MAREFHLYYPEITLKAWLGDNHYSDANTLNELSTLFGCQVISRLKSNQNVRYRGKNMHVAEYFRRHSPVKQQMGVRGGKAEEVCIGSARLFVPSHKKKRFVLALKYQGEEEYRYLIATDLTWRTIDIVECFTLRWLIEVFIEDFKGYEGWGQLAKQQGEEGSSRGLILSLLCDLCLFLHPSQVASFENKLSGSTVGSLLQNARAEALFAFITSLVQQEEPDKLDQLAQYIEKCFNLKPSKKHMSDRQLGRMQPTPSLKYRGEALAGSLAA